MNIYTGMSELAAVVTDDSRVTQVINMVPSPRSAVDLCTTEYDCRDLFAEVNTGSLQKIKEEHVDVCYIVWFTGIIIACSIHKCFELVHHT